MAYQTILFEKRDGIGYITLNRPEKLNAISRDMLADLRHVLTAIEKDQEIRVVILTGAGRAFSAGLIFLVAETKRSTSTSQTSGVSISKRGSIPS